MYQQPSLNSQQKHILNNNCEKALIDFPFHDEASTWLEEHKELFYSIKVETIEFDTILSTNPNSINDNFANQFYFKFKGLIGGENS